MLKEGKCSLPSSEKLNSGETKIAYGGRLLGNSRMTIKVANRLLPLFHLGRDGPDKKEEEVDYIRWKRRAPVLFDGSARGLSQRELRSRLRDGGM